MNLAWRKEAAIAGLLLLASLSSWYFYDLGLSPTPLLGFLGLAGLGLWLARRGEANVVDVLGAAVLLVALAVPALAQLLSGELRFEAGRLVGLLTFLLTVPLVALLLHSATFREINLLRVLAMVMAVHLAAIFLQLGWFVLTRDYLDLLYGITGEWQRVYGSKGLNIGIYKLPRFAGLFNEPGTYSGAMLPLYFLYRLRRGRADLLYGLALFSVLLTMSAFGLAGVLACLLYEAVKGVSRRTLMVSVMLILTALLTVLLVLLPAYESRFSGSQVGSVQIRVTGLQSFAGLDTWQYLFGRGPAVDASQCADCIGLYLGTGLAWLYYLGIPSFIAVFLLVPLLPYRRHLTPGGVLTFLFFVALLGMLKIKFVYPWLGWLLALGGHVIFCPRPERLWTRRMEVALT